MLELAAIGAAYKVLEKVIDAVTVEEVAKGIAGNRADAAVGKGWGVAGYAIGCFRKNWTRLEPQENHVLYRAMLLAHWRAVQQTAQQHARHRGIDLKSVADALPLPATFQKALSAWSTNKSLGLLAQIDQEALRELVRVCDERIAKIEKGDPIDVPTQWTSILETTYDDITTLVQQTNRPAQGPAEQAWSSLAAEFPQAAGSEGFQPFFLAFWFEFFSVNFQFLTREPTVAPLLTGKLFHEIKVRDDARALDPQKILDALQASEAAIRGDIAELKSLILESLRQPRLSEPEPLIGLPNTRTRILARDAEADELLEALRESGPRIVSVVAPPGFGKSGLFAHAFARTFPNRNLADGGLAGVAVLDARVTQPDFPQVASLLGRLTGRQETASRFADLGASATEGNAAKQALFLDFLRACGPLWIVIENAESAMLPEANPGFRALLRAWCAADHEGKLLVLSRQPLSVAPECHKRLATVERALYAGLPRPSAVELLQDKLSGTSHSNAAAPLLERIAARVHGIPLALVQFAGYLRADETIRLDGKFIETSDLLQLFDPDQMEASIARVVEGHLKLLDATSRLLLRILAWARNPVPESGLVAAAKASGGENVGQVLTRLSRSGLVNREEARSVSFGLHPVVQDIVTRAEDNSPPLTEWSNAFWAAGSAASEKAQHYSAEILYSLMERGFRRLVEEEGRREMANDLAAAVMNRGNVLRSLGRLDEAVAAQDEAIAIRRQLVEEEGRRELANALAGALMNRGNALGDLGRLDEAVLAYDEAIAIRRHLVEEEDRGELANDLASALMNRGVALDDLGRLDEAVLAYDEAIAIRRQLVEEEDRRELTNDLAMAAMNRGNALWNLGRLDEAILAYDEAIAIRRQLVEEKGRRELAHDLAGALMNRGNALAGLGRLDEAVLAYDEAIAILRQLVEEEGRRELANALAMALYNLALAKQRTSDIKGGCQAVDEARRLWGRLVSSGWRHLDKNLADATALHAKLCGADLTPSPADKSSPHA